MKHRATSRPVRQSRPDAGQIFGTWIQAYEDGDLARLMSIFDPDLRYIEPCEPEQNFDSLASWFKYDFARKGPRPSWTVRTESIDAAAEFAVIVSTWSAVTNHNGFSAESRRLRSIDFLRHGEDGWRIFRTINDPLPCGTPLGAAKRAQRTLKRSRGRTAR